MSPAGEPARAAFFDVDETLIAVKSMFRFLRFYLDHRGEPASTYERITAAMAAAAAAGAPRGDVNRAYYRAYQGESVATLTAAGRRWAAHEAEDPALWLPACQALAGHAARGAMTVLVSGSFFACLDPIAEMLGADHAHGTTPEVHRGVLTGQVRTPMIGEAKARRLDRCLREAGLERACSVAYGDHASDLPMLRAAGTAVVVGDDPVLCRAAAEHGWARLPGCRVPA